MSLETGSVRPISADVVVVSMADTILLMVTGRRTPENVALIDEVRTTLVATGTPTDAIAVIWS